MIKSPNSIIFEHLKMISDDLEVISKRYEGKKIVNYQSYSNTKYMTSRDIPNRFWLELRLNDLNDYLTRIDANHQYVIIFIYLSIRYYLLFIFICCI